MRRRFELEQSSDGRRRPAADPRNQPRSHRRCRAPEKTPRIARIHRHEPELLDDRTGDGHRTARTPVRREDAACHDDAGDLRRRLRRRGLVRDPRQRDPVHFRRGSEDRVRAAEDSRPLGRSAIRRDGLHDLRAGQPRTDDRRPSDVDLTRAARTCHARGHPARHRDIHRRTAEARPSVRSKTSAPLRCGRRSPAAAARSRPRERNGRLGRPASPLPDPRHPHGRAGPQHDPRRGRERCSSLTERRVCAGGVAGLL